MNKVISLNCDSYEKSKEKIQYGLRLLFGENKIISPGMKILIKPNICAKTNGNPVVTTNPIFLSAIIDVFHEYGAEVWVGENSGGRLENATRNALAESGIEKVIKEKKVRFINFQEEQWTEKSVVEGRYVSKIKVPQCLEKFDYIVNVPKLKTHYLTGITAAIKNMFGCIHYETREYIHRKFRETTRFSHAILDVYKSIPLNLTILDAIEAMDGKGGPICGDVNNIGMILISENGVAVDLEIKKLLKISVDELPVLKALQDRKDYIDVMEYQIEGERIGEKKFKSLFTNSDIKEYVLRPSIKKEKCLECGFCIANCPVAAITKNEEGYKIEQTKCISCLCCQEFCNAEAVNLDIEYKQKLYSHGYDILRIEEACNLKCVFCTAQMPNLKRMSYQEVISKINYLKKKERKSIAITGGEPTLRNDILSIIKYAKDKEFQVQLQTNAIVFENSSKFKSFYQANIDSYFVSLHAYSREEFMRITGVDAFEKVCRGLKNLIDNNCNVTVNHVVTKYTYKELNEYVKFINVLGIRKLRISFINPNIHLGNDNSLVPSLEESKEYICDAIYKCIENSMEVEVEGIPFCFLGDFCSLSVEWKRMIWEPYFHIENKYFVEDTHYINLLEHKAENKKCVGCPVYIECPKVWKGYAQIYGTDELKWN